ncbi:MAG: 50S ribosomal protein L6 [Verrucomicrobia bacterium]|jgi:large subunit ribosomal protein L6|nr:50S ribosomal protein L6 [Verrucomicrobiota bacterium]
MSRIGKKPISIPPKVKVSVGATGGVTVEGPKGKLEWTLPSSIAAKVEGETLSLDRKGGEREDKALHGLSRALLANMVTGVTNGFRRDMEIHGVGFKAAVQGKVLNLSLGKSHPILFQIPEGVKITVAENTKIAIEGIDNQIVGQCAANIRAFYPPEPYKGKGVRFAGEQLRRKEGKTVQ